MTEPHHIFAGLHVLLVSDDSHRVSSLLASLREREARAFDMGAPRDDASALMAADLIVVDTRAEAGFADTIHTLEADVRARWAPIVRVDYATILPGDGSVHLKSLAELCAPSLASERELTERTRRDTTVETGLAPLGPTRLLRALAKAGPALYVAIASEDLKVEIELANELLVSAKAEQAGERFDAWSALTRLLPLDQASVRVERRPFPAGMNIMEPLGQALEVAAQEYLCGEDKRARAAVDSRASAQRAEPARSESLGRGQRTLIGMMAPGSLGREERPFVPARPPRPSLPTSPRTEPLHLAKTDFAAEPSMEIAAEPADRNTPAPAPSIEVAPEPTPQPRYEHRTGSSYGRSAPMTLIGFKAPAADAALPVVVQPALSAEPAGPVEPAGPTEAAQEPAASAEQPEPEVDLRATMQYDRSAQPGDPSASASPEAAARSAAPQEASIVIDEDALGEPRAVASTSPELEPAKPIDDRPTLEDVEPQEGAADEDDESLGAETSEKTGEAAIDTDRIGGEATQETVRLDASGTEQAPQSEDTWVGQKDPDAAPAAQQPAKRGKLWPLLVAAGLIGGLYVATQRNVEVSDVPPQGTPSDSTALDQLAANEPKPSNEPAAEQNAPPAEPTEPATGTEPGTAPATGSGTPPATGTATGTATPPATATGPAPATGPGTATPTGPATGTTARPPAVVPAPAPVKPLPKAQPSAPAPSDGAPLGQKSTAALEHEGLVFLMHHSRVTAAKAKPIFEEIVAREPLNPHGQAGLAQALLTLGDAAAAKPYIEEAIKLRGRRARYRVIHGDVLAALGQPEEARASWQRAIELDPRDAEAQARTRSTP